MSHTVPLDSLLAVVRDGDEHGWRVEFDLLWETQQGYMDLLATSIQETGMHTPILIGSDGRVWDGHHRLAVAHKLGLAEVPIKWVGESDDQEPGDPSPAAPESPADQAGTTGTENHTDGSNDA